MSSLFHKIFFTCKDATVKVLMKDHKKLSWLGKFRLKIHVWVCGECLEFEKQNQVINSGFKSLSNDTNFKRTMCPERKKKIQEMLSNYEESTLS